MRRYKGVRFSGQRDAAKLELQAEKETGIDIDQSYASAKKAYEIIKNFKDAMLRLEKPRGWGLIKYLQPRIKSLDPEGQRYIQGTIINLKEDSDLVFEAEKRALELESWFNKNWKR